MFAIHRWGSEEQKQTWLSRMAAGEAAGCFWLTEPDVGSDPASMCSRARRDGADWTLDARKMWITNASIADVAVVWADRRGGPRIRRPDRHGGANGISLEYPVMRHVANLESVLTYEGTNEMHTLIVGQALTGQALTGQDAFR